MQVRDIAPDELETAWQLLRDNGWAHRVGSAAELARQVADGGFAHRVLQRFVQRGRPARPRKVAEAQLQLLARERRLVPAGGAAVHSALAASSQSVS